MQFFQDVQNAIFPELILLTGIIFLFILHFIEKEEKYNTCKAAVIITLIFSGISMFSIQINPDYYIWNNNFIFNIYTLAFKVMIILGSIMSATGDYSVAKQKPYQFFSLFLFGIFSSFSIISANSFLSAFICSNLLLLTVYYLLNLPQQKAEKISAKIFKNIFITINSVFLVGIVLLKLLTGTLNFSEFNLYDYYPAFIQLIFALISICMLINISLYHFLQAKFNVFQKTEFQTNLFITIISLFAQVALISRAYIFVFSKFSGILTASTFAALILTVCSTIKLQKEKKIKKIYSLFTLISIGLTVPLLCSPNPYSISSAAFYAFIYLFTITGLYTSAITENKRITNKKDYAEIFAKAPFLTAAFFVLLFSFAGFPPGAGFISRLYLCFAFSKINVLNSTILAVILICTVFISIHCFKFSKAVLSPPKKEKIKLKLQNQVIVYLCSAILILIFMFPNELVKISQIIAYYI